MQVKVHPHYNKIKAGIEQCVSVTPKNGTAHYAGTVVMLDARFVVHSSGLERAQREQVRNVHAWCVGDLIYQSDFQLPYDRYLDNEFIKVTYHYNTGRFIAEDGTDVTDGNFISAYFCGKDFYVTKEW